MYVLALCSLMFSWKRTHVRSNDIIISNIKEEIENLIESIFYLINKDKEISKTMSRSSGEKI